MQISSEVAFITVLGAVLFAAWQDLKGYKGISLSAVIIFLCWLGQVTSQSLGLSLTIASVAIVLLAPMVIRFNLRKDYVWLFLSLCLWFGQNSALTFLAASSCFSVGLSVFWIARWRALVALSLSLPDDQEGLVVAPIQTALSVTPYGLAISAGALVSLLEAF